MKFRITETGEFKTLSYVDAGVDRTVDIVSFDVGVDGAIAYNDQLECYEATADTFAFWEKYLNGLGKAEEVLSSFKFDLYARYRGFEDFSYVENIIQDIYSNIDTNNYETHYDQVVSLVKDAREVYLGSGVEVKPLMSKAGYRKAIEAKNEQSASSSDDSCSQAKDKGRIRGER